MNGSSLYARVEWFGKEWVPKSWFAYFRLYEPTETYFDKSWPLGDFENVK